tara:strand:+ start:4062 stop:4247 length:186 start_codon:yes stop_codon:yes gene_type:complete
MGGGCADATESVCEEIDVSGEKESGAMLFPVSTCEGQGAHVTGGSVDCRREAGDMATVRTF